VSRPLACCSISARGPRVERDRDCGSLGIRASRRAEHPSCERNHLLNQPKLRLNRLPMKLSSSIPTQSFMSRQTASAVATRGQRNIDETEREPAVAMPLPPTV
jgi:hypothetical protein